MTWVLTATAAAVVAAVALLYWRERRRTARLTRTVADLQAARQEAIRLLRLTAADLRGPALALAGNESAPAGLFQQLLQLAEGLLELCDEPDQPPRLAEEPVEVGPLLDFVIAQVSASLAPGSRAWRIDPSLAAVQVLADRRALHQVLLRIVSAAALATREADWIDVAQVNRTEGWGIAVEDEGLGLAIGDVAERGPESRGLGLGLSLARRLLQAHGGTLTVESAEKVGTRVVLILPPERLL